MRYTGKCAVVTGASSGMGRAIALRLAKEGATVIAVARRESYLKELAEEAANHFYTGKIIPYPGDLTLQETNDKMIDFAVAKCGKLDVLVNDAGIMDDFQPVAETSNELWDKVFAINLNGPFYAIRKAVQVMLNQETGGNIVNIVSNTCQLGCRTGVAYTASKHAFAGMIKNTAYMYAHRNIRCNGICPGAVNTNITKDSSHFNQWALDRIMTTVDPENPAGTPEDIAAAVAFLGSDEAKFFNGSLIMIDGGQSAG